MRIVHIVSKLQMYATRLFSVKSRTKKSWSIESTIALAQERGGNCLSTKYLGTKHRYTWICGKGHIWEASLFNIYTRNSWCPFCAGKARRSIGDANDLAKIRGGQCLSTTSIQNVASPLQWKCEQGHIWTASFKSVHSSIHRGSWCPQCAAIAKRLTLEDAKNIAFKHGGDCLSKTYTGICDHLLWICSRGHKWNASLNKVRNSGTWCPICRRRKNQKECHEIFSSLFPGYNFEQEGASDTWKPMRVDGYCEEFDLVWEYHGIQHYKFVKFFHRSIERFEKQLERDKRLRAICKANGLILIEIPYWVKDKHIFIVLNLCQNGLFHLLAA